MPRHIARDTSNEPALPVALLRIPVRLSGAKGSNRGREARCRIAANDDVSAVAAWLARYVETPGTMASYRKEAERLLLWAVIEQGKSLSSLTHEDLLIYQRFLANPQPAARWVMAAGKKPGRASPLWRPFAGALSASSARCAITILNTMFAWLVDSGYLASNPLSLSRRRGGPRHARVTRYLSHELWDVVKTTIESLPADTEHKRLYAARCRWLFTLLYLGALRAAEIACTPMGAIFHRADASGVDRWWIEVRGKGQKTRLVPATAELIAELMRYRNAHGLPPTPRYGETGPLLLPLKGHVRVLSRSAVHIIVKDVFARAAAQLRARGPDWHAQAETLACASAHWIRHTAGSHMTDERVDLRFVRDNLGHASLATTSIYLHTEEDARHQATEAHHHIGWASGG